MSHRVKTHHDLGKKVRDHLIKLGIETPMVEHHGMTHREQKDALAVCMGTMMRLLNLDVKDDSLKDTPTRIADMFVDEMFVGLDYTNFPKCTVIENKMANRNEFIIESGIQVDSVCEHHFVTIDGKATVAYVPQKHVLGLSKMNRIVEFFSRRPQVQERLTCQIAEALAFIVDSPDVAVYINAVHYCVKARGVKDVGSCTSTFHGIGRFSDINDPIRREFMERSRAG